MTPEERLADIERKWPIPDGFDGDREEFDLPWLIAALRESWKVMDEVAKYAETKSDEWSREYPCPSEILDHIAARLRRTEPT